MVSNNQYYKAIAELLNEEEYTGEHNDGYYLKRIVEHYGVSYSKVKCKGKYLKDWARAILGTVTGSHANNYYLKNIAKALTSVEYSWRSENRYLKIILDNIADISKVTTKLLWGTPPTNLVYGDEFNATVTLTEDSSNNPIPDATVEMICGSTTIGTGTTDSNGVATVTAIPMSAGSHRFYFKYNGSVNYSGSFSSEETISVGKETCILNVTSPSDYTSIYTDSSVTVTGTLTENDTGYPPMKNTEINYSIVTDGSTVKTGMFDTDNNGAFNTVITGFTTDTTTNLILSYTGDSNYNSVSKTIPLTVSAPSLVVSSDKSILSYADSESATLTATLQSGDNVGKTITFYNVTDDVQLGTGVTDSNGVAVCNSSYNSQGSGDVELSASVGTLQSESYSILDAKYYASNSKIESEGVDYNHQRLIFVSDYEVSYDDVIHFRFGNTVPNTLGLGISSKSYSNDVFIEKVGSTTKLYRNTLSQATLDNPFVANHDFCMKPIESTKAGGNDQCWLYDNDTYIDWYSFKLTNKKVRVDKYYSYPFTIEIIVL